MDILNDEERNGTKLTYETVSSICYDWELIAGVNLSCKEIWPIFSSIEFEPYESQFAGGQDGRIIAYHHNPHVQTFPSISVHDHTLSTLYTYDINEVCGFIFFHVTINDYLIVITNSAHVYKFFEGEMISMVDLKAPEDIICASFWDDGCVIMDKSKRIFIVEEDFTQLNQMNVKVEFDAFSQFSAIPPHYTNSGKPIIFASDYDENIQIVSEEGSFAVKMISMVNGFAFSPNYEYVAFLCDPTTLIVCTSTLDQTINQFDIPTDLLGDESLIFERIGWMGDLAPLVCFKNIAILSVTENEYKAIPIDGSGLVISCQDSVMVMTCSSLMRINLVTDEMSRTCKEIPHDPAAKLVSAFAQQHSSMIESLKVSRTLIDAINDCISTARALTEKTIGPSKMLLLSAQYGRSFLNDIPFDMIDNLKNAAVNIRLSNEFKRRFHIVLTPDQISTIPKACLIKRILNRKAHYYAFKVAEYLGENPKDIITDWCRNVMILYPEDDEIVLNLIKKKVCDSFDGNAIVSIAYELNRSNLAQQLADLNSSKGALVPFYVKNHLWEQAVSASISSSDTTLLINVMLEMVNDLSLEKVAEIISKSPISFTIASKLVSSNQYSLISGVIPLIPDSPPIHDVVLRQLLHGIKKDNFLETVETIRTKLLKFSAESNSVWIDQQMKLLDYNVYIHDTAAKICEKKENPCYLDMTLHGMISSLLTETDKKLIDLLKNKKLGMNEKRYRAKVALTMAKQQRWDLFKKFADPQFSKNYQISIAICHAHFGPDKANEFISLLNDHKIPPIDTNNPNVIQYFGTNEIKIGIFGSFKIL